MSVAVNDDVEMPGGLRLPNGSMSEGHRSKRSLRVRNAMVATSFDLAGKRVLDVGCANGLHSLYMSMSAKEVVGIDHRVSMIEGAKATARALEIGNVNFIAGDIRDEHIFDALGKFDLIVAWGFLHRITDIFSLIYSLEGLADTLSFEWRSPIIPMMSSLSIAYHSPGGRRLDPTNVGRRARTGEAAHVRDEDKIEGDTSFWEPTPGAVAAITRRLGYKHTRLLGYGDDMLTEAQILKKAWARHMSDVKSNAATLDTLPRARLHMLFERKAGAIKMHSFDDFVSRLPRWDEALLEVAQQDQ